MEIYWDPVERYIKDNEIIRHYQHGFTKGKPCLISLISFYAKVCWLSHQQEIKLKRSHFASLVPPVKGGTTKQNLWVEMATYWSTKEWNTTCTVTTAEKLFYPQKGVHPWQQKMVDTPCMTSSPDKDNMIPKTIWWLFLHSSRSKRKTVRKLLWWIFPTSQSEFFFLSDKIKPLETRSSE